MITNSFRSRPQAQTPEPAVFGQRERAVRPVEQVAPAAPAQEPEVVDRRRPRAQATQVPACGVGGPVARGAAAAGRGQVGHTEGLGGPAAFGLREQRAGVRERDFTPFVVVQETETPETQVRRTTIVDYRV